jgi:hypothetical protein
MFSKMEVRNAIGDLLTLQLGDTSTGINLLDVAGLDPVKATFASSKFANQPGSIFQASTRENRNITLKIGLDPDPAATTVRALRQLLYSFFETESAVNLTLYFDDDTESYVIDGRVEDCSAPMFAQEPEVHISVICFDPDFYDPVPVTVSGIGDSSYIYVPYAGTSSTGVTFTMNVNSDISQFNIYYYDPNMNSTTFEFAASLLTGDVVTVNTVRGSKSATLLRAGVTSSILYGVSPQTIWPQLVSGDNWFQVWAEGTAFPVSFQYTKRFGGL